MASGTFSRAQTAIVAFRSVPHTRQCVAPSQLGCPTLHKLQKAGQHMPHVAPISQSRRQVVTRAEAGNGSGPSGLSINLKGGGSLITVPDTSTDHDSWCHRRLWNIFLNVKAPCAACEVLTGCISVTGKHAFIAGVADDGVSYPRTKCHAISLEISCPRL